MFERIKNFFKKGAYRVTEQRLTKITDHPKIAVTEHEYSRIQENLKYFESEFANVIYKNSDGDSCKRSFNHLPIAKTVSKKIASLVYNEKAEITVTNEVANEFIQKTLFDDRFNKNFERYLESALALGGMAMRPYVDDDHVRVSFIQAPVFYPLQSNTQDVSSAAIVTKTTKTEGKKNIIYTLIEFHEWNDGKYVITNELYRTDRENDVGYRVPLEELYEDLEETVTVPGLSRPLFTYLKTPGMNNRDINSPLGLSIFDNAKTSIDFINKTYDEFAWEIKMGQRRVAVPEQTVRTIYDERGDKITLRKHFDPDQNVFMQIGSGDIDGSLGIVDLTTPIRSDDYIKAINKGLSLFEMQIGVSPGMFSFDGKSMKTATEVVSENSDTYQMRNSIVSLVEQSIKELIVSICELASAYDLYSGKIPDLTEITVDLDDGVFTDRNNELEYWTKAVASGLVSKSFAIQKILDFDEAKSQEMINEINGETRSTSSSMRNEQEIDIYGE
ncbi:phage portal protein [Eremococcus coleocola]|uniref:phage portal protein n=1 Tax=Eremococcus coleocola TaxID=88132 RepID=UPI0004284DF4|nr:phage portal protein [Eremococcus coleocola]